MMGKSEKLCSWCDKRATYHMYSMAGNKKVLQDYTCEEHMKKWEEYYGKIEEIEDSHANSKVSRSGSNVFFIGKSKIEGENKCF